MARKDIITMRLKELKRHKVIHGVLSASFGWDERRPHVLTVRKNYKPSAEHPWRRFKINESVQGKVIHNINNYPQKEKESLLIINNQT